MIKISQNRKKKSTVGAVSGGGLFFEKISGGALGGAQMHKANRGHP
jgi:hypothetical protein